MNYGILNALDTVLQKLLSDIALIGFTIASLTIVISVILIMFDTDTSVTARSNRWQLLRRAFIGAVIIAAASALITFAEQIGHAIHG